MPFLLEIRVLRQGRFGALAGALALLRPALRLALWRCPGWLSGVAPAAALAVLRLLRIVPPGPTPGPWTSGTRTSGPWTSGSKSGAAGGPEAALSAAPGPPAARAGKGNKPSAPRPEWPAGQFFVTVKGFVLLRYSLLRGRRSIWIDRARECARDRSK